MELPRLREWRERRGYTQRGLAAESGVSERSVASYEVGHNARPNTAYKLAFTLGVTPEDLLDLEEFVESRRGAHPKAGAPSMPGLPDEGTPRRALLEAARELEERAGETAVSVTDVSELLPWAEGLFGSITTLVRVAHELGVGGESEQIWQPNVLRVIALTKLKRDEILSADDQAERLEIDRKFEEIVRRVPA